MDDKHMKKTKKETKGSLKWKKLTLFILVFAAVYGFTAVDEAYSDMMDQDGKIAPDIRRVNSDIVTFSMFGQTAVVNTTKLETDWCVFSGRVTVGLDAAVVHIQDFLGIEEPERDYSVFKTEIL
jgi:hypothetical protein